MSRENVTAFYQRLATDEAFKQLITAAKSKEECSQIVKQHGYEFTQQEWEDYTANLLESFDNDALVDLDEKELEAVMGGFVGDYQFPFPMNEYKTCLYFGLNRYFSKFMVVSLVTSLLCCK